MQRVNYGRALLEMALIRICLLEQLTSLAEAVRELREGGPPPAQGRTAHPTATATPAPRSTSGNLTTGSAVRSDSPKSAEGAPAKKNIDTRVEDADVSVSVAAAETAIELRAETIDALWAQLLVRVQDTIAAHLKNANRIAIFGPNALEIAFPKSYSFSKNYFERPETLRRIQGLMHELVGRIVDLRLCFDVSSPEAETPRVAAGPVRRTVESVAKDAYLQQVMSIFCGTLVDVRVGSGTSSAEG
jgi:DNA polymerase-3 subunit gamma/tau